MEKKEIVNRLIRALKENDLNIGQWFMGEQYIECTKTGEKVEIFINKDFNEEYEIR